MTKPTISELEANWNIHLAGLRAEKEAREKGVTEDQASTLMDAAAGGRVVAGVLFPPITAAYMLMLNRVEELAKTEPVLGTEMGNLAALALILHSPEKAWALIRSGSPQLFADAVTEFAMLFTLAQLKELMSWVGEESKRLAEHGDDAGKPSAA